MQENTTYPAAREEAAVDVAEAALALRNSEKEYWEAAPSWPPGHPWRRSLARRISTSSTALNKALALYEEAKEGAPTEGGETT